MGMIDMAYNMGAKKLKGWKKFNEAIDNKDWLGAGLESSRAKIDPERNGQTLDYFFQAHEESLGDK